MSTNTVKGVIEVQKVSLRKPLIQIIGTGESIRSSQLPHRPAKQPKKFHLFSESRFLYLWNMGKNPIFHLPMMLSKTKELTGVKTLENFPALYLYKILSFLL